MTNRTEHRLPPSINSVAALPATGLETITSWSEQRRIPAASRDLVSLLSPVITGVFNRTALNNDSLVPLSKDMTPGGLSSGATDKALREILPAYALYPELDRGLHGDLSQDKLEALPEHLITTAYVAYNALQTISSDEQVLPEAARNKIGKKFPGFLDLETAESLESAGGPLLHDIGKSLHLDWAIAGPLSTEQFSRIKRHPADGVAILRELERRLGAFPQGDITERFIMLHHASNPERAYPDNVTEFCLSDLLLGLSDRLLAGLAARLALEVNSSNPRKGEAQVRPLQDKTLLGSISAILVEFQQDSARDLRENSRFPSHFREMYNISLLLFNRSLHRLQDVMRDARLNGNPHVFNESLRGFMEHFETPGNNLPIVKGGLMDKLLTTDITPALTMKKTISNEEASSILTP